MARKGPACAAGALTLSLLLSLASSPLAGTTHAPSKPSLRSEAKAKPTAASVKRTKSSAPKSTPARVSPSTRGAVRDARAISRRSGRHVEPRVTPPGKAKVKRTQLGVASFYGPEFAERPTASGELFDPRAMTAAHRTLPLGTRVRVTNLENGRQTVVRINDRGPYRNNRVIDLSRAAARKLGFVQDGIAHVRIEVLKVKKGDKMELRRAESARLATNERRVRRGARCDLADAPKRERT
jgi:rare lipoprotein A